MSMANVDPSLQLTTLTTAFKLHSKEMNALSAKTTSMLIRRDYALHAKSMVAKIAIPT